jgi:hypothetical protein
MLINNFLAVGNNFHHLIPTPKKVGILVSVQGITVSTDQSKNQASDFWNTLLLLSNISYFELLFSGANIHTNMEVVFGVLQVIGDPKERNVHFELNALHPY